MNPTRLQSVSPFSTPWKIWNEVRRVAISPLVSLRFWLNAIPRGKGWRVYGLPTIQKHRRGSIQIGPRLNLRSTVASNPLGAYRQCVLSAWREEAALTIGSDFAMTGGSICATQRITIGDRVTIGANTTIVDSDFHPLDYRDRRASPNDGHARPITIGDDVFIGMNCLILKGVTIGSRSVIGAGSVVTTDVPMDCVVAGNPARVVRRVRE